MPRYYVTTTIPYVNARPHLGFALELVQADVLARRRRQAGQEVRFLTGTDDNSLKNVLAAQAQGVPVQDLVDRNAAAFQSLRDPLALSFDDFIRTSSDPRHRAGVERLWERCAASGDLYRKHYEGLYCVGCEQFYPPGELTPDGRCPEHGTVPQLVAEENWFFRLSRHADRLRDLITGGRPADRARLPPQGGARPDRLRAARLLRLALPRPRPRLGHPRPRRPRPGRLRLVGRPRQLRDQPRLRRRVRGLRPVVGGVRGRPAGAPGGQGRTALPRRVLAGDAAVGGPAAAHGRPGARLSDGRRPQDQQVRGDRGRPGRTGRRGRYGRGAVVAAARRPAGRRRGLHPRTADRPRGRRPRGGPRKRGEPDRDHGPPLPGRARARGVARGTGRRRYRTARRGLRGGGRARSTRRWTATTSGGPPPRCGRSWRRRTARSREPGRGSRPGPSAAATRRPGGGWTPYWRRWCGRACVLAERLEPFLPGAAARIAAQCAPVDGVLPAAEPLFPRIGA